MSSPGRGQLLRGRAIECETLRDLVSAVRSGSSRVLVLRGEAGVGRTALLDHVAELASGFRCVQVAGIQSDMELAFAGLQQLCAPLIDHHEELPEPQREALAVAFGCGLGPTPDRLLVGLAVLSLMAAAANDQPLLCAVDSAQWLDQVSVQTLGFVARRFLAEPVALVFAARDRGAELMCSLGRQNDGQALGWISLGLAVVQETAAGELWDDTIWVELATNMVRQAREVGALAVLPPALVFRAGVHVLSGEWATASTLLEEAASIAAATTYAPMRYHSLTLPAWRGIPSETVGLIETFNAEATARGEGRVLSATRTGNTETAAHAVRRLEERPGASGTDWGLGLLENARALVASDDQAEVHYLEAIERLERTRILVHRARAHPTYGEWLRRTNHRLDARKQLNRAHEMYAAMGAQAFAERARRELVATGERVRKQTVSSADELTVQETQIARLAGDGFTNQEIGAQLFISTHTVEWHLRRVFVKLGITSRRQLRTISWAS